jgi:hypothetical protein
MPALRSNDVPYFSGRPGDPLADFLHEYDGLASSLGLTDVQKAETILRYVPANIREFWQTLNGYTRTGLQEFVKVSAWTRIQDEDDLILYHRRFSSRSAAHFDFHGSSRMKNGAPSSLMASS